MKKFNVPDFYRSPIITKVKQYRKIQDPRKRDNSPTILNFGKINYLIARHFGFCYGVENAIDISFKAIEENEGKRIFLLSQMIHNPDVNNDLIERGVQFLQDTNDELKIIQIISDTRIKENLLKSIIDDSDKLEYIFKCILSSFSKKRKKPIGVFTDSTVILFNNFVDRINTLLDNTLKKMREIQITQY